MSELIVALVSLALGSLPLLVAGFAMLILLWQSIAIVGGDQFITLERRWFGKGMTDGRTVALRNEVGVQARTLGPGGALLHPLHLHCGEAQLLLDR